MKGEGMKIYQKFISVVLVMVMLALSIPMSAAALKITSALSMSTATGYFLKNAETGKYVQIDDNQAPGYTTDGAFMENWDIDGGLYQRWSLEWVDDSPSGVPYYVIRSQKSGLVIGVRADKEDKSGYALEQKAYDGEWRQQWCFTQTSRGTYVIRPRSSRNYSKDWCMCVGSQFLGITDGVNVEQKAYDDDSNLKDEWYLEVAYDTTLLALNELQRYQYANLTYDTIRAYISDDVLMNERFNTYTVNEMISMMQHTQLFFIHTHGSQESFTISTSGDSIKKSDFNSVKLDGVKFAMLMACETAAGSSNIAAKLIDRGVDTVIGFSNSPQYQDCNLFAEHFIKNALTQGWTIARAKESTQELKYRDGDFYDGIVILGNDQATLN